MRIYMAGLNGIHRIVRTFVLGGGQLSETLSCQPAHDTEISERTTNIPFHDGGGILSDLNDEDISCRKHDIPAVHSAGDLCNCSWQGSPRADGGGYDPIIQQHRPFILESFYYADADTERLIPYYGDFLLDSGAFTFMQGKGGLQNWDDYVERYADFIVRNNVQKYFELDIDSVVGYDRVRQIRSKLESIVGRPSIPVWHKSRGKEEFIRMCEEYPYVAIGGLVDGAKKGEYARSLWQYFPWFIQTAHKNKAKIHALGFTSLDGIKKYHFDSVDSTAWTTGNRFGYLYYFDGTTMQKKDVPKNHRLGDSRKAALHNYTEWIKFQKYAETHL